MNTLDLWFDEAWDKGIRPATLINDALKLTEDLK